ncbi:toll-like receptor 4 [Strongylocentrotus purpuratus]|uniref:TIR domain-containing protein n=1 Tax=Strongylocentrotus purpuratus TaxID=7668 RepID=A0A7M7GEJ2_STRPU|nr:toll-like receptor 4 [Strongylocentrotus purpuratus]|eukprot:XP_003723962.1 PREDICTED: CD180 antigen-like [Strongylocentrotus purpuratus]
MAFKHGMLLDPSLFLVIISFLQALPADTTVLPYKRRYVENSVENCAFEIQSNTANCERLRLTNVPKELPEDVEILRISENSIKSLLNSSFERYPHVTYLDVSDNDIRVIEPITFYPLKELALLRMFLNPYLVLPTGLLRWATKLSYLDVSQSGLKSLPGDILRWSPTLDKVFLSNTELTSVNISLCGTVGSVFLSKNNIEQLTDGTFTFTCQTDELYLTRNPIRSVDPSVIESLQVRSLMLGGYTLTLDVVRNIFIGVSRSKIKNLAINYAASLEPLHYKPLLDFDPSELCGLSIPLVRLSSLAVICLVAIAVLLHHYRWQLRHRLCLLKFAALGYLEIRDTREHDEYEFDLNIIFYDDDEAWVREHLRLAIEEQLPQFQSNVFGDEDLVPGMHYLEAVDYVVRRSYKTVVLLSSAAVRDRWFMLKFRTAMDHVSDTQTEFVFVIFLEDIPDEELPFLARMYLSDGRPYLHWPEDIRGQLYFFDELTKNLTINLKTNDLIPDG